MPDTKYVLAIDQGTTSSRAIVFDHSGHIVETGQIEKAEQNAARLKELCPSGCEQVTALASAINRGPTVASAKAPAIPKTN